MSETTVQIRSMSPAKYEQMIKDLRKRVEGLEIDLENERLDHGKTRAQRDCYRLRIDGFERVTAGLAEHVDKICRDFDAATGGKFRVSNGGVRSEG